MIHDFSPLVSIIITTYKRSDMLSRAIKSVLQQSYSNIEIIVVDDNDSKTRYRIETEAIMKKFEGNNRIRYVKHSHNLNGAAARNTGLNEARGQYVTYLDDDDTYRENKVFEQVEFLKKHPQFDAVYCGWRKNNKENIPVSEGDLTFGLLSGEVLIITNSIMINREVAISFGGWDETFRRNQEAAFLLRYFKKGFKIGALKKVLVDMYTTDRSNVSNSKQNEQDFEHFFKIHNKQIENSSQRLNKNKNIIYSFRYRGIMLNYLKKSDFVGAIQVYLKMMKKIPWRFNRDIVKYFVRRMQNKNIFT